MNRYQTNVKANKNGRTDGRKYIRIIRLNDENRVVTEHWSLLTLMDALIDMVDIFGMNPRIDTGDMGISLVRSYNIISKVSLCKGTKTKLLVDKQRKLLVIKTDTAKLI